jgi:hypothetical protein
MRARLLLLAVVLGTVAFQLSRGSGHAVAPLAPEVLPVGTQKPTPRAVRPLPGRDPFRFAREKADPDERREAAAESPETRPLPTPEPPRVRFVGLVRRQGQLRAALVVDGTLALAAPGETLGGFRLLSIEGEAVRVSDSKGQEMTLLLPEEP